MEAPAGRDRGVVHAMASGRAQGSRLWPQKSEADVGEDAERLPRSGVVVHELAQGSRTGCGESANICEKADALQMLCVRDCQLFYRPFLATIKYRIDDGKRYVRSQLLGIVKHVFGRFKAKALNGIDSSYCLRRRHRTARARVCVRGASTSEQKEDHCQCV